MYTANSASVSYVIIDSVIVNLSECVDVVVQLCLLQDTVHHTHQDLLVPVGGAWLTVTFKRNLCLQEHN